jgi:hypothetical protein
MPVCTILAKQKNRQPDSIFFFIACGIHPNNFTLHFKVLSMKESEYLEHLQGIQGLIESRSKFKALSGLSGVIAGCFALIGAWVAHLIIYNAPSVVYADVRSASYSPPLLQLLLVAGCTLVCSVATGLYFSSRNARRHNTVLWNRAALKVLWNFCIPAGMGGFFTLVLLWRGYYSLIAACCLMFYGLALINASNFTFSDVRKLGLALLGTSALALLYPGNGLYFWAFGFGVLHILYGAIMYFKYER